jgi:hypothetical protein
MGFVFAFEFHRVVIGTLRLVPMHRGLTSLEKLLAEKQLIESAICQNSWEIGRLVLNPDYRSGPRSREEMHIPWGFVPRPAYRWTKSFCILHARAEPALQAFRVFHHRQQFTGGWGGRIVCLDPWTCTGYSQIVCVPVTHAGIFHIAAAYFAVNLKSFLLVISLRKQN